MTETPPARPKLVAYYRVSTQKQGRSGLGLEAQVKAAEDYAQSVNGDIIASFQEVESGRKHHNRPELAKALLLSRQKKAFLIIARLDRLARNVAFTANLIESKVPFVCCDMPLADEFTLHIYSAMSQKELQDISKRTKLALAAAKARGVILGSPRPGYEQATAARSAQAQHFRDGVKPLARQLRDRGLTLRQIAQELNERHVKTCNDTAWYAQTVSRLLKEAA